MKTDRSPAPQMQAVRRIEVSDSKGYRGSSSGPMAGSQPPPFGRGRDVEKDRWRGPLSKSLLGDGEGGIAEEVVDLEQLGESAGVRVVALGGQDRVPEPRVSAGQDLAQDGLVVEVRRVVQAQPAWGEGRDHTTAVRLEQLLGERVHGRELE